jgi:UDP-2,4-diacetamido-2,4,6-trideoxy-beta-L-altropyranose hydrolase
MGEALFIRTDAGAELGVGHFMRMLALGEAWAEADGRVAFGGTFPEELGRRARAMGAEVFAVASNGGDARWTVDRASEVGARVVVADGYHFPVTYQRSVRAAGLRLLIVDDNAENQPYDADWILNANVHATEAMYEHRNRDCRCLLGPRYVLIRAAIRTAHPSRGRAPGGRRLLVTMGGADPPDATGRILSELRSNGRGLQATVLVGVANARLAQHRQFTSPNVTLLFDVEDVAPVMLNADVALAAAGGTLWELGLLGVPCVALALADNQVSLAEDLHRRGAIEYAGDARSEEGAALWLDRVCEVLADSARSAKLVSASRGLVDGNGARRVVECIKET